MALPTDGQQLQAIATYFERRHIYETAFPTETLKVLLIVNGDHRVDGAEFGPTP